MTKAFENATKLRPWVDPVAFGADPTGATASDAAFIKATATGLPLRLAGNFKLDRALAVTLAAGQDFVIQGAGPEAARLVFATGGLSVTYAGDTNSFGDKTSICIDGIGIETDAAGTADALKIINTATAVVNDTEGNVALSNLSFSGTSSTAYWDEAIYLENVAFPHISSIKVEDGGKRTTGLSITTTGSYNSVDTTITDFKVWEVLAGVKVRGRAEGIYLNQFVAVGCTTGVDWVATLTGGKKPLLLLDGCHINTSGTAVRTTDVAQVIASDSLIYIPNSTSAASYGFDFQATSALSSENSRINGCTVIGQGDRTGALSTAVRCGANVFGVTVEATIDNVGTCVDTVEDNRTVIAPGSRLSNYNMRSTGMYNVGKLAGGTSGGVSVDSTVQMEAIGADSYERDQNREQLRAGSFTYQCASADEVVTHALTRPFRTDASVIVACFGAWPSDGAEVVPDSPASTADTLNFRVKGAIPGSTYRVNYIAYGY